MGAWKCGMLPVMRPRSCARKVTAPCRPHPPPGAPLPPTAATAAHCSSGTNSSACSPVTRKTTRLATETAWSANLS